MRYGAHLPQNEDYRLNPDFIVGQLKHEAGRGNVWVSIDSLIQVLRKQRHFSTTDLQLMLRDLKTEGRVVTERKRAGHGMAGKVCDHYALK